MRIRPRSNRKFLQLNVQGGWWYKSAETADWAVDHDIDLISVSETWLCSVSCTSHHICHSPHDISHPGWSWTGRERESRGGGVGFLLREKIPYRRRRDLECDELEMCWIEIFDEKPLLVCSIYVPPGNLNALQKFSAMLQQIPDRQRALICGDLNSRSVAFGDSQTNALGEELLRIIADRNLFLHNPHGIATHLGADPSRDSVLDFTLSSSASANEVQDWHT